MGAPVTEIMDSVGNYLHPLVHTMPIRHFSYGHCLRQRAALVWADSWKTKIPGRRNYFRDHVVRHNQPFARDKTAGKRNSNACSGEVKNDPQAELRTAGCSFA
jgi:hypothetical protein